MPRCITGKLRVRTLLRTSTNPYHQSFTQQTSRPGTGQALGFRHGRRSLPLGAPPGCSGPEGGEQPPSCDTQRLPKSVQEPPGQQGRTRHPRLTRQRTQGTGRGRHASTHPQEVSCCQRRRTESWPGARSGRACCATVCVHVSWKMFLLEITQFFRGGP